MDDLAVLRWGPASKGVARQLVVLCHGVAADGHDLIDLGPAWSHALPDAVFVAPDAPFPYEGAPTGRQWFSLADRTPSVLQEGARVATPPLLKMIEAELARLSLAADQVAIMGFSQGAMLALHAGLRRAPPPRGILAYSGALLDTPALEAECVGHPPVLLVHGEDDEVVPFARAGQTEAALTRLGLPLQTLWCKGLGHAIDDAGLSAGALFLQRVFSMTAA